MRVLSGLIFGSVLTGAAKLFPEGHFVAFLILATTSRCFFASLSSVRVAVRARLQQKNSSKANGDIYLLTVNKLCVRTGSCHFAQHACVCLFACFFGFFFKPFNCERLTRNAGCCF